MWETNLQRDIQDRLLIGGRIRMIETEMVEPKRIMYKPIALTAGSRRKAKESGR
jgi:hypothetical protein